MMRGGDGCTMNNLLVLFGRRQCKMHKRRVDLLEGVVKELNPTYFLTNCQELWFELGETYNDMLDTKLVKLQVTVL